MPLEPPRPATLGRRGAVASSHPAVSISGIRTLADGGNAIDATLAMAATSWLALPGQCGVGGDAFAVVREPDGAVWTLNGSGLGPDGGTADFYRQAGHRAVPLTGPLSVAVPGGIAALAALHAGGATRSLGGLWQDGVRLAEEGIACTEKTRADIGERREELSADPEAGPVLLPGGEVPRVGAALRQGALARTIRTLAEDPASLYEGELADRALGSLRDAGAPFSGREWASAYPVRPEPAVTGTYAGHRVFTTPMPTPGWMLLQQAATCDGVLSGFARLDTDSVHWLAEAARQAFRDRFASIGSDTDAWTETLRPREIAAVRTRIGAGRPTVSGAPLSAGDTTSTVCVDAEGRAVSFIQSLAFTFGSRVAVPGTGMLLNNRLGRGAYLIEGHPNEVRPGRKPLHTLTAWITESADGRLSHVGNTPGGDGQVQWNMQVLSHLLDHANTADEAVRAPRFTVFPGSDADVVGAEERLLCEPGIEPSVRAELADRGHRVEVLGPYAAGGSQQVISVEGATGSIRAASDPRMGGVALAI